MFGTKPLSPEFVAKAIHAFVVASTEALPTPARARDLVRDPPL
jgi:hypothetical protein